MSMSNMTNYLKGRTLSGTERVVSEVRKKGDRRIVIFSDGTKQTLKKQEATLLFNRTLATNQKQEMAKTMSKNKDGTVSLQIGGKVKGVKKTYKNERGAKIALGKLYGKK